MDGLVGRKEKPSNTEVLGLLLDEEKLKFISNLNDHNIKGLCKLDYFTKRLKQPDEDPIKIHTEVLENYLALKCSLTNKDGNRAQQIVEALKHIIDDENKEGIDTIASQIKG